jgi:hypothetical protein
MHDDARRNDDCGAVEGLLPLFGMELLSGEERARVVEHLAPCGSCTARVRGFADVGDALLLLAPQVEPPLGLDVRVLEAIDRDRVSPNVSVRPHRRSVRTMRLPKVGAALVAVALIVGFGLGRLVDRPASPVVVTHPLVLSSDVPYGSNGGSITLAGGDTPWMVVSVAHLGYTGDVTCVVTLANGSKARLGRFWIADGDGSWSTRLPVRAAEVKYAKILTSSGALLAAASV